VTATALAIGTTRHMQRLNLLLLLAPCAAFHMVPAYPVHHRPYATLCAPPKTSLHMTLPKEVALIFFAPWAFTIVVNNLPTNLRLRIQKSAILQSGVTMRTMPKEKPKIRGVPLIPEVRTVTSSFRREYRQVELELLWAALLRCYGSKERALQAVQANPQIMNPSYTFPNTVLESRRVLGSLMSQEEALEVMLLNPAVLQCGPSLELSGASEIKALASLRSLGNSLLPTTGARVAAIAAVLSAAAFVIAATGSSDASPETLALLDVVRPALGLIFGSTFAFAAYSAR